MRPAEYIEFSQSIEGLFLRGLGPMATPALKQALRGKGLDLDKTLLPGYPAPLFHQWVELAAATLYPGMSRDEAVRRIGHCAVSGLEEGVLGKAVAAGLKLVGPRRALQRVDRIFKNNNNYQVATLADLQEHEARVQLKEVFGLPAYYQGLFESAMRVIGAKEVTVTVLASPPPGATLHIAWSA